MKIVPRLVEAYLARPDSQHRALLLYGPDTGLVRERARALIPVFLGATFDRFALAEFSAAALIADPARLADELSAISMLAPKRVLFIDDAGDKLTRVIEGAAEYFNDGIFVIACADELSARSSLRNWFEKGTNTAAIACYKDEARDVQEYLRKHFAAAKVTVETDAMEFLAQQLGNDRGVTRQEAEKLITYAGENGHITLDDATALVGYNRDTNFDELVNAVAGRDLAALEKTLGLLLAEASPPVAYLRALQRYFNRLYYINAQMHTGQSAEAVIQSLKPPVFFKQVPLLTRHAQSWNREQLIKALKLLVTAELACKTSDIPILPASHRRLIQVTGIR